MIEDNLQMINTGYFSCHLYKYCTVKELCASRITFSRSSSGTTSFQVSSRLNIESNNALLVYQYRRPSSIFQLGHFFGCVETFFNIFMYHNPDSSPSPKNLLPQQFSRLLTYVRARQTHCARYPFDA